MRGIILVDLDETLHNSAKIKAAAWKHILDFFDYQWNERMGTENDELRGVEAALRPPRGLAPKEFIRQLLANICLSSRDINRDKIQQIFSSENDLFVFLENEWSVKLLQAAKEIEIEEIPGALNIIRQLYDEGYRIGVVTQAPSDYAEVVLEKLQLITTEKNYISTIVGGEMVRQPKPHPESLIFATQMILLDQIKEFYEKEENIPIEEYIELTKSKFKPLAFIGDSDSDKLAGEKYGIPVYMIDDILREGKIELEGKTIYLDSPHTGSPEKI